MENVIVFVTEVDFNIGGECQNLNDGFYEWSQSEFSNQKSNNYGKVPYPYLVCNIYGSDLYNLINPKSFHNFPPEEPTLDFEDFIQNSYNDCSCSSNHNSYRIAQYICRTNNNN